MLTLAKVNAHRENKKIGKGRLMCSVTPKIVQDRREDDWLLHAV